MGRLKPLPKYRMPLWLTLLAAVLVACQTNKTPPAITDGGETQTGTGTGEGRGSAGYGAGAAERTGGGGAAGGSGPGCGAAGTIRGLSAVVCQLEVKFPGRERRSLHGAFPCDTMEGK